ncbi:MAG: 23S rRNA (pseudouridine(1915)-N(3))-methyltransferase RlmH [Tannerellaceae bacterium]|jgi:23S rRNA (pseudouridine1915-N3)-methyltransferase|nr:23S rRNA (pseudouridine(1915)-N(3))-methyltransferase RlmH [Tannerellaceae bacterium]
MKILLLIVGKTDNPLYNKLISDYENRLEHYISFAISVIPDIKKVKNISASQQKNMEGEKIIDIIQPGDYCILLDERGKEYSSPEFASFLSKRMLSGCKRIVFIIGGPYGFGENVYAAVKDMFSLSRMTFSHQMVRLFFVEQLYRAFTIINNEPYHHN